MKIVFTRDFRSAGTGEQFYRCGMVADLPEAAARAIIYEGAARPAQAGSAVDSPAADDGVTAIEIQRARDEAFWAGRMRRILR